MAKTQQNLEESDYWHKLMNQSLVRFFILKALRDHQVHGYILGQLIEKYSWGICKPTEGTLYPALNEMEKGGYIKSTSEIVTGRERKIYRITDKGKSAFRTAAKTWAEALPLLRKATIL
jgi:PadR family transcriptional regulator, regulatory protein PadR